MSGYYAHAREEVLPHLPNTCERVLELGCGEGATLARIRGIKNITWAGGVEFSESAAAVARTRVDALWVGDAEKLTFDAEIPPASLDVILCLDVLEHLVEPWAMVQRLSPLLKPGGRMIISIPNVRNWKFIFKLLFKGDFHYRDAGLLDRTHLRFFTRGTAVALACAGGLSLVSADIPKPWPRFDTRSILSALTRGGMKEVMAKQWLVVVERI